jgi:uncharacterized protein (TIGR02246 family)
MNRPNLETPMFKIPTFAALALSLLAGTAAATPDRAQDEKTVRAFVAKLDAAWNAHSPEQFVALYDDDSVLVPPSGKRVVGKRALFALHAGKGPTKKTTSSHEVTAIQWLDDDLVMVDAVQTLKGPGVKKLPGNQATITAVLRRDGAGWKMVSARVHPVLPPPSRTASR